MVYYSLLLFRLKWWSVILFSILCQCILSTSTFTFDYYLFIFILPNWWLIQFSIMCPFKLSMSTFTFVYYSFIFISIALPNDSLFHFQSCVNVYCLRWFILLTTFLFLLPSVCSIWLSVWASSVWALSFGPASRPSSSFSAFVDKCAVSCFWKTGHCVITKWIRPTTTTTLMMTKAMVTLSVAEFHLILTKHLMRSMKPFKLTSSGDRRTTLHLVQVLSTYGIMILNNNSFPFNLFFGWYSGLVPFSPF